MLEQDPKNQVFDLSPLTITDNKINKIQLYKLAPQDINFKIAFMPCANTDFILHFTLSL